MMGLPFKFLQNSTSNKTLGIDISSDAVRCVVFYDDVKQAKIVGVGKQSLEHDAVHNGSIVDFEKVEEATRNAIFLATNDLEENVNNVIFGTRGDLSLSLTTTARSVRESYSEITQKEIEGMYAKLLEAAVNQANEEHLEITADADTELELVTSSIIYTKIDGKKISAYSKEIQGKEIELAIFTSFTPNYHVKSLQKLAKKLGLKITAIASEAYSFVRTQTNKTNSAIDCVIMDIGSDATEVTVVFGGGILTSRSLHIGSEDFTTEISQRMGVTEAEAKKLIHTYCDGKLSESECMIVQNCIQEALNIWLNGIELLFGEFTGVKTFAPQIYICGQGVDIPDIAQTLEKEPWSRSIPFKSPPELLKVGLNDLSLISDSTSKAVGNEWLMPSLLSVIYLEAKGII